MELMTIESFRFAATIAAICFFGSVSWLGLERLHKEVKREFEELRSEEVAGDADQEQRDVAPRD